MTLPPTLDVGLKEWATVDHALGTGRQVLLLRKGGILEQSVRNRFSITHDAFLLFPTYLHQTRAQLKPDVPFEPAAAEPDAVRLSAAGVVTDIMKVASREQVDRLDDQHIWTSALIDMRFNYKPQNPLYLVLVRAYRWRRPVTLPNTPAYAGCKSWVPLGQPVDTSRGHARAGRRGVRGQAAGDPRPARLRIGSGIPSRSPSGDAGVRGTPKTRIGRRAVRGFGVPHTRVGWGCRVRRGRSAVACAFAPAAA